MRDNKLLIISKDGPASEEEKTKAQKIEEEIKTSIFSVFYLILKNNEVSYWKYAFILLIEYIQLLSYSFDESVSMNALRVLP